MSSDCRRFDGHRAAKGAFQRRETSASLKRALHQLRHVQPWGTTKPSPVAVTVDRPHDAGKEADRG